MKTASLLDQTVVGAGPDTIAINVSEDAFLGDARFTISVDGTQIGGVQTATASHALQQQQTFLVNGDFGTGPHSLTVNFLNDFYAGTPGTDRNLYVDQIERGGIVSGVNQAQVFTGPLTLSLGSIPPPTGPVTIGSGPDSIELRISEDAWQDDAQFTVSVDGVQIGGVQTATASHAALRTQSFTALGAFGAGPHAVSVKFLNDAYGGTPATDRNLWVDSIVYRELTTLTAAPLWSSGTRTFAVQPPRTVITGTNITGPVKGHAVLNGTPGDDTIVARGTANTIVGNGGSDTIKASKAGGDTVTAGAAFDGLVSLHETIMISGRDNSVTTGDEAVSLSGIASGTIARLGNGTNTVSLAGPGNSLQIGSGENMLSMTGGHAAIHITGFSGATDYADTITFSGKHNNVSVGVNGGKYPATGNVTINGGIGYGTFNLGWSSGTVHTDGPGNVINFGFGTFDVTPGSGNDTVVANGFPGSSVGTIHLAGSHNIVRGYGAQLAVTGGTGSGIFEFNDNPTTGSGSYSLNTDGAGNVVTQHGGDATIRPGGGGDSVSIFGGKSSVILHGSANILFVHPGQQRSPSEGPAHVSTLNGSTGLQAFLDPGFGEVDFAGFDSTSVIHLLGGVGGFTTPSQIAAAVVDTGGGLNTLLVGSNKIVFSNNAPLTASQFAIG